jgi:hypothetical protein
LPSVVGDWIEEFEDASEAVDSVMDGLDPLLELLLKMPILSGEGCQMDNEGAAGGDRQLPPNE